jgi:hypothetical protein
MLGMTREGQSCTSADDCARRRAAGQPASEFVLGFAAKLTVRPARSVQGIDEKFYPGFIDLQERCIAKKSVNLVGDDEFAEGYVRELETSGEIDRLMDGTLWSSSPCTSSTGDRHCAMGASGDDCQAMRRSFCMELR